MVSASRLFFRAALVFMATVAVILSGGRAAAQGGPQWQPGVTLATLGGDAATTATIRIVTGQQPMSYRIGDMATVSFSMMDTRGEELIRFLPQSLGGTSHIFESRAGTFALEPRSSGLVLAALQTSGNGTGTAIMRISDIDGGTTPRCCAASVVSASSRARGTCSCRCLPPRRFAGPTAATGHGASWLPCSQTISCASASRPRRSPPRTSTAEPLAAHAAPSARRAPPQPHGQRPSAAPAPPPPRTVPRHRSNATVFSPSGMNSARPCR